jgi:hypothetical protein
VDDNVPEGSQTLQVVSSKQNLAQHYSYSTQLEEQSTTVPTFAQFELCALLTKCAGLTAPGNQKLC